MFSSVTLYVVIISELLLAFLLGLFIAQVEAVTPSDSCAEYSCSLRSLDTGWGCSSVQSADWQVQGPQFNPQHPKDLDTRIFKSGKPDAEARPAFCGYFQQPDRPAVGSRIFISPALLEAGSSVCAAWGASSAQLI